MTDLTIATEAGELALRFTALGGIAYEVQESGDLIGGWTSVQTIDARPGTAAAEARFAIGAEGVRRFYRVVPIE